MRTAGTLRRLRRRSAAVAAATTMTLALLAGAAPAAVAAWDSPSAAQPGGLADPEANRGTIGLVDAGRPAQGAPLVTAGKTGQQIADVALVIPNRFAPGDVIDVRLFDRSATQADTGAANTSPETTLAFTAAPTVAVAGPAAHDTRVDTAAPGAARPWAPRVWATGTDAATPGVTPTFAVDLRRSVGGYGRDTARLTVTSRPATGDPNGRWVVRLTGLAVDLGPRVSPGELRLVPFARNAAGSGTVADPWFHGNRERLTAADETALGTRPRDIATYTVPAWVAPVTIAAANPTIAADGTPQSLGALTVTETQPVSLGSGRYRLDLRGATIANPTAATITARVTGGGQIERVGDVTLVGTPGAATGVEFALANPNPTTAATITLGGLDLAATAPAALSWRLTGGTIDAWLAPARTAADDAITIGGRTVAPATLAFTSTSTTPDRTLVGGGLTYPLTGSGDPATDISPYFEGAIPTDANVGRYDLDPYILTASGPAAWKLTRDGAIAVGSHGGDGYYYRVVKVGPDLVLQSSQYPSPPDAVWTAFGKAEDTTYLSDAGVTFEDAFRTALVAGDTFRITNEVHGTFTPAGGSPVRDVKTRNVGTDLEGLRMNYLLNIAGFITITAKVAEPVAIVEPGVNEGGVASPREEFVRVGTASASGAEPGVVPPAVGGADRFETARIIARRFSAAGEYAIVVSGVRFPDALSSGFLAQRLGAPILLTGPDTVPQATLDSLAERGVTTVFVVGGPAAVGEPVVATLRDRGLDVRRLGGLDRYDTNRIVNTYAVTNTAGGVPVGTIRVPGGASKRTAMVARGDTFPDALTANILTAGRIGGLVAAGPTITVPGSGARLANPADVRDLPVGGYTVATSGGTTALVVAGRTVATSTNGTSFVGTGTSAGSGSGLPTSRTVTFAPALVAGDTFTVSTGNYVADRSAARVNALPLILTPRSGFNRQAAATLDALRVEHVLLVGGRSVLPDAVQRGIETTHRVSTQRLGGVDRFDTARLVNEFALAPVTPADPAAIPGLGFDGGGMHRSPDPARPADHTDGVAYLVNGLNFPDALVAGPWVSVSRDLMLLTTGADLTGPTRAFLTAYTTRLDRAVAIGLRSAVDPTLVAEANRLATTP